MTADTGAKAAGVIFYLGIAGAAGFGAYWIWPEGVTDVPLSRLTLGLLLKVGGSVLLGFIAFGAILGALTDAFD
jgi:hypothetical protein